MRKTLRGGGTCDALASVRRPARNGETVGFKFELKTVDGDDAGPFETAVPNWQTGDTLIAAGNVRYRVVSVIPADLVAEFVDGPDVGIVEVEPL
jgi:hypothetical protein